MNVLLQVKRAMLDASLARQAAEIALETGVGDYPVVTSSSAAGDARKLRGLPAVGVRGGLGGAIAGTRPGDGLDRS